MSPCRYINCECLPSRKGSTVSAEAAPQIRPAERVILIDADDRILLIRSEDPSIDQPILWLTPGGGCEPGETPRQAATRELWEETGIHTPQVGPHVWHRQHIWRYGDRMIDSREDFFLLRCEAGIPIAPALLNQFEVSIIREHRWWSIDEILAAHDQFFVPRRLAELVASLLRGEIPTVPLEIEA
jgi:8-oxo-dGTP pyrophosphatase MutT (NUDIX family)